MDPHEAWNMLLLFAILTECHLLPVLAEAGRETDLIQTKMFTPGVSFDLICDESSDDNKIEFEWELSWDELNLSKCQDLSSIKWQMGPNDGKCNKITVQATIPESCPVRSKLIYCKETQNNNILKVVRLVFKSEQTIFLDRKPSITCPFLDGHETILNCSGVFGLDHSPAICAFWYSNATSDLDKYEWFSTTSSIILTANSDMGVYKWRCTNNSHSKMFTVMTFIVTRGSPGDSPSQRSHFCSHTPTSRTTIIESSDSSTEAHVATREMERADDNHSFPAETKTDSTQLQDVFNGSNVMSGHANSNDPETHTVTGTDSHLTGLIVMSILFALSLVVNVMFGCHRLFK